MVLHWGYNNFPALCAVDEWSYKYKYYPIRPRIPQQQMITNQPSFQHIGKMCHGRIQHAQLISTPVYPSRCYPLLTQCSLQGLSDSPRIAALCLSPSWWISPVLSSDIITVHSGVVCACVQTLFVMFWYKYAKSQGFTAFRGGVPVSRKETNVEGRAIHLFDRCTWS
jgi:hypothetical protein